jgi:hypothetical protein
MDMSDLFSDTAAPVVPAAPSVSHVPVRFNPYPWKISLEAYKTLEAELLPNDRLIKLSIKLTERLNDSTTYGHVAAYLYGTWAKRIGRAAVLQYWLDYDAHAAKLAADDAYPHHADDYGYDDDIPF